MAFRFIASIPIPGGPADSLWRQDDETMLYERWDPIRNEWVEDHAGIRESGIGGDSDMEPVSARRAAVILSAKFNAPPGSLRAAGVAE